MCQSYLDLVFLNIPLFSIHIKDSLNQHVDSNIIIVSMFTDNRIISGSRLQELKFECRKCYTTIFTIGELRKIQDLDGSAHFAVIGQAIMSKCRKDTNITNMNKTFGASFTKTGDLLCRSCNNDLGVLTQYEPLGYMPTDDLPVVKICSFLVTESSGKTHTFKQWKQVKFAIDVLSPDPDLISPEAQPS